MNGAVRPVSLADKYVLDRGRVYITGIQALVRLPLDRVRLDREAGLSTRGFISGYRGSPLAGYDQQLVAARRDLDAHGIVFTPGVNEELAATAVWGSQKVVEAAQDGVFGIWYGKAPGVDRSTDVFKHANQSGTARHGGVLAVAGDDHLAKSSTVACQSEFQFIDCEIPVLNPADLQDVVDFGLYGLELSRWSGLWVSMIAVADTMDSSGIVDVGLDRHRFRTPRAEFDPRGRDAVDRPMTLKARLDNERSVREIRLPAAIAHARANRIDRLAFGSKRPRVGFVATGKAYRDLRQALALIGIDDTQAARLGIAIYKVGMSWPLEPVGLGTFARGLERLVVVEHKRALMEPQIKELAYHWPDHQRPRIWGKATPDGEPFLSAIKELSAADIVPALMAVVPGLSEDERARAAADGLVQQTMWAVGHAADARRSPYFCSGCPHNISTKTPEGARSMPGIGCHAMTEIAERTTEGLTAMGGEGVPWVGQAPFTRVPHMFANLGDGTYFHSGLMAIRQSIAAKVPITYKILFNDAVAMTGGQHVDGLLTVPQLTRQLEAEGAARIVVVADDPDKYGTRSGFAPFVEIRPREELLLVEAELAKVPGCTVLIYDQVCAAEKRRRRKKGTYPDPAKRLFINDRVCEDCGDCSKQSNCVAVEPVETAFGRKRRINQGNCNKDFSCETGFCPSFVEVIGGHLKRSGTRLDPAELAGDLPAPVAARLQGVHNLLVAGIGGMGVTTAAAVLAMAAHVDGLDTATLDMTGLAQKGGPVTSHVRVARLADPIEGPRVPTASLDVLIAADMLVAAGAEQLAMASPKRTAVFANGRVVPTAEFVLRQTQTFQAGRLAQTLEEVAARFRIFDAGDLAERLFGDALYVNMILIGAAAQAGDLPITFTALETAVRLNGAAVEANLAALAVGRALIAAPERVAALVEPRPSVDPASLPLDERLDFLAADLVAYHDRRLADDFRARIARLRRAEASALPGSESLTRAAMEMLHRVTAIKDEYEVARHHVDPAFAARIAQTFEGVTAVRHVMAPPFFARHDPATGRPRKSSFGPWILTAMRVMASLRRLRGSVVDPFGHTAERRTERRLRDAFRADVERMAAELERDGAEARMDLLADLARWPREARGYGPVKDAGMARALATRDEVLAKFDRSEAVTARAAE
ncbi:MAG: indolepyruvate ferredoxin oxidoreductase family protein [Siculibacillus sp.]|nr:indolepyruvate ferredoxin oxidoreductase family protein [Siculibacillus sp.]